MDSFDDKNRMRLLYVCSIDFSITFIYSQIVYFIFYKIAKNQSLKK